MSGCMTDAGPKIMIQLIKDGGGGFGHGTVVMEFLKNGGLSKYLKRVGNLGAYIGYPISRNCKKKGIGVDISVSVKNQAISVHIQNNPCHRRG